AVRAVRARQSRGGLRLGGPRGRPRRRGDLHLRYGRMDDAVRGLMCSAGGARAVHDAGPEAVRTVLVEAMRHFEAPRTGAVSMANTFRWLVGTRSSPTVTR